MTDHELLQAISDMMDEKLEVKLEELEEKLDKKLEEKLDKKFDEKFDKKFDERLDKKFDEKLAPIYLRLDRLESDVSDIKIEQVEMKKELKQIDYKVSKTYEIALDAWGQSTENRIWLEKNKAMI